MFNGGSTSLDVLPTEFHLEEVTPKPKSLAYVDAAKIIRSAQKSVAWGNALTAMGSGIARQQSAATTTSSGTVIVSGSDGSSATGNYKGTSTSRTSSPDYGAQARAVDVIRERNAGLDSLSGQLSHAAFKANTVFPNQAVRGIVLFERDKKIQTVLFSVPVDGTVYEFPFTFVHQ